MIAGFKVSKNYAWECVLFRKIRRFGEGSTSFELHILDADWYHGDHNPRCTIIHWVIFNITIIEMNIYNVNHVEEKP